MNCCCVMMNEERFTNIWPPVVLIEEALTTIKMRMNNNRLRLSDNKLNENSSWKSLIKSKRSNDGQFSFYFLFYFISEAIISFELLIFFILTTIVSSTTKYTHFNSVFLFSIDDKPKTFEAWKERWREMKSDVNVRIRDIFTNPFISIWGKKCNNNNNRKSL